MVLGIGVLFLSFGHLLLGNEGGGIGTLFGGISTWEVGTED